MAGVLIIPASMHAGAHAPSMGYLSIVALVAAEAVREISRITYFRTGQ